MNKWKILRAVVSILLLVVAAWQFYPYLEDLKKLHEYRDTFSSLWIAVAIVAQGAQYVTEGYTIKELQAS